MSVFKEELAQEVNNKTDAKVTHKIVIDFLNISQDKIATKANELFQGSGNYHDARFDTAAAYLLVIEGIKQKYIKPGFFSEQLKK